MTITNVIEAENLGFTYDSPRVVALQGLNFIVPQGAFCAVIGPNGSGKSTLVKLILGLSNPTEGEVRVMGSATHRYPELVRRLTGYVPQREAVNSNVPLLVSEVISLAAATRLGISGHSRKVRDRVTAVLEMVGLQDMRLRPFNSLSGGQQQRVLIARALAVDPHVLVLDEPFSAVDAASQNSVVELLHRLASQHVVTIIAVVHNINPLVHYVDHVLLLRTEQIAFGDPGTVLTPENLRVAYGSMVPILVCEEGYRHPVMQTNHHE